MQRKALKQLGKVTQWTNEKVFSGEKTQFSDEFSAVEKEIEPRRIGIERLHATSLPFFQQLTKVKPTADPYPPAGSGKEKILHTEALGLVMIDYGGDIHGPYGDALSRYGRSRCKLAVVQEEFGSRLSDNYIAGMETALAAVNEYKTVRKKLESRRLTLDAAISRLQGSKKDPRMLEEEVNIAQERFEEVEDEARLRLQAIEQQEADQFSGLSDLLDAELEYFGKCVQILEELRENWPTGSVGVPTRPRANTASSARSAGRARSYSRPSAPVSDDEDVTPGRARSQSNASSVSKAKEKRSMLPSLGSFGKKSGLSLGGSGKRKAKYGQTEDDRMALHSEEDDEDGTPPRSPSGSGFTNGRNRSNTTLSVSRSSLASDSYSVPPPMRRTQTTPANGDAHYVKVVYDFAGTAADELPLRAGQVVEIKKEVSDDWCIGESEGRSGLFPKTYCEDYVPTPLTAAPALPSRPRSLPPAAGTPPVRRSLPPAAPGSNSNVSKNAAAAVAASNHGPPSPAMGTGYATDESYDPDDASTGGFDDGDHYATASLAFEAQPAPVAAAALRAPVKKTAPPPPPPSRRSQSSSNLYTASSASYLSPPQATFARPRAGTTSTGLSRSSTLDSSPEGSPFAGSGDEDDHEHLELHQHHQLQSAGSPTPGASPARALSSGLGGVHLTRPGVAAAAAAAPPCASCGCDDFTQNVFKAKGVCSTCFHSH